MADADVTFTTIIARNYLPYARVLMSSVGQYHPDARRIVLLIDALARESLNDEFDFEVLALDELFTEVDWQELVTIYDVTELATAVKPRLLGHLLDRHQGVVVYLDPDIEVYSPLGEAIDLAQEHHLVLTPHTVDPMPRDGLRPSEAEILASGVYNLGFLAVGARARPFLDWWWRHLQRDGVIDHAGMLFTDQRWVDFVPGYFEHAILRHRGYNVAYWNVDQRPLDWDGSRWTAGGEPLRFFHFSGSEPGRLERLSKHQGDAPRTRPLDDPPLRKITGDYHASVDRAGDAGSTPYR